MKKLLIVLFVFLVGGRVFAQEETTDAQELFIQVYNNTAEKKISAYVSLVSTGCWANSESFQTYHPTTTFTDQESNKSVSSEEGYFGFDFSYDLHNNNPPLPLGKFEISMLEDGIPSGAKMTIDLRTDHLGEQTGSPDIFFKYDVSTSTLYHDNDSNIVAGDEKIWELCTNINHSWSQLQPYTPDNFSISASYNNHPKLTWSHSSEEDYITGYNIYRAIVQPPHRLKFYSKIATVGHLIRAYIDDDLDVGDMITAYYKISSANGTTESVLTDEKSIRVLIPKEGVKSNPKIFTLNQNYPNPFNPTTSISYSIPNDDFVLLKVYDIMGKEVALLENEQKKAGIHTVYFNAGSLSSGIYIYKITAGKYSETKKLMLVK